MVSDAQCIAARGRKTHAQAFEARVGRSALHSVCRAPPDLRYALTNRASTHPLTLVRAQVRRVPPLALVQRVASGPGAVDPHLADLPLPPHPHPPCRQPAALVTSCQWTVGASLRSPHRPKLPPNPCPESVTSWRVRPHQGVAAVAAVARRCCVCVEGALAERSFIVPGPGGLEISYFRGRWHCQCTFHTTAPPTRQWHPLQQLSFSLAKNSEKSIILPLLAAAITCPRMRALQCNFFTKSLSPKPECMYSLYQAAGSALQLYASS